VRNNKAKERRKKREEKRREKKKKEEKERRTVAIRWANNLCRTFSREANEFFRGENSLGISPRALQGRSILLLLLLVPSIARA
jgi:hypothetical protein